MVSFVLKFTDLMLLLNSFCSDIIWGILAREPGLYAVLENFFKISSFFTKIWKMILALETEFLNPRWKLIVQDRNLRRNTVKIIPLACWTFIDLQRHDLEDKLDQNPKPRNLTSRQDKTILKNLMTEITLVQQCQEGEKDTSSSIRVMACLMGCKKWHWWDTYLCKCKELWSLMEGY